MKADNLARHYSEIRNRLFPPRRQVLARKVVARPAPPPAAVQEPEPPAKPVFITRSAAIIHAVAEDFGLTVEELVSPHRHRRYAFARQVAMHLMREMTSLSLPQIAMRLKRQDHTSVLYGLRKIAQMLETDEALRARIARIESRVAVPGTMA